MTTAVQPLPAVPARRAVLRTLLWLLAIALVVVAAFWASRFLTAPKQPIIPTVKVRRGDLSLALTAHAEVRGGDPETLTAPMTGDAEQHITSMLKSGDNVKPGDVVVQLNTGEQEFKLKEAESDLAEAEQHLIQAKAQRDAETEEGAYELSKAKSDVTLAELDVRKNPLLPAIVARQNDLALAAARDKLAQLEHNIGNRQTTNAAAIAIQDAGRTKALEAIKMAREHIDSMTLKAHHAGYVSIKTTEPNMIGPGMVLPPFQVGDTVRPGLAIAEIPDLEKWEVAARMEEMDRGHVALNDKVAISVIALPGRQFHGHVSNLGGITGSFWERHFECKIALDDPVPELRPGMSAMIVMTTDELRNVLWIPAQALFEADGRTFVYVRSGKSFVAKDVKLVRRNETRAIVTGVAEGREVALSNPLEIAKKKDAAANPLQSVPK
jgi:multidrug efflux pump subunit AcrA (membrane-fusion protein)